MSYWICTKADILEEGQIVCLSFKDKHSLETMTLQLAADTWKDTFRYKCAYEEPQREMWEVHKNISRALWSEFQLKREEENKSNQK